MEGIRRGDRLLRLVATNWETGELRTFENRDMTDEQGHDIIIGSAAIPGIFHPHEIAGQPYVDGGLVMNTPLSCAIEAGATTVHVIYMDPDVKNIPLRTLESSIDALDRVLLITSASKVGEDIETAAWINEGLEVIERTAGDDSLSNADLRAFVRVANQIYQKIKAGAPYKKVTIHRYHPQDDLGGGTLGLLNFDKDRMVAVIKRGFDDALNHDCDASHCILPKET
jgi:predicted acylesterase/phospholipase RssA